MAERLAKRSRIVDDAWEEADPRIEENDFVAHRTPHPYTTPGTQTRETRADRIVPWRKNRERHDDRRVLNYAGVIS